MIGRKRGGNRGHGAHVGEAASCREHCGSPEAMPHEETNDLSGRGHRASCADDVPHVAAEAVAAELSFAAAEAGKIKSENTEPVLRQRPGHAHGRQRIARACEAVRKNGVAPRSVLGIWIRAASTRPSSPMKSKGSARISIGRCFGGAPTRHGRR
jgi:hypothetical protein